jgi:hypothetical protein
MDTIDDILENNGTIEAIEVRYPLPFHPLETCI